MTHFSIYPLTHLTRWACGAVFALLLSIMPQTTWAQVTVSGSVGVDGSYTTLGDAFTALNGTPQTGATIGISLSSSTTELASAILHTGVWASVTITATAPVTISGSIVGAVVKLNGADNVTIDGRIGGTGRNITIQNTSTASATAAVWLASVAAGNGATGCTVRNCEIACGVTQNTSTSTTFGIIMSGTSISTTSNGADNDNNSFIANRIVRARYGILTRGTAAGNKNRNIVVTDNIVGPTSFGADQIGKTGIYMQADSVAMVSNNTVQFVGGDNANTTGGSDRTGIAIGSDTWGITTSTTITSANYTVMNNLIHDIIEERTFSAAGLILATTGGGSATNNIVCSNMIYNIKANGTAGDQAVGLGIVGGHTDQVTHNSIYMSGDVDPNPLASATTMFGNGIRIVNANGGTHNELTLKNNIVYMDLSSSSTATVRYYAITGNSAAYSFGLGGGEDYNDYYINPTNTQLRTGGLASAIGLTATTEFATLADWKLAYTVAQDANSQQVDPGFVSPTDLHINVGSTAINNLGTPAASCSTDYDNDTRSATTPDIGADEYTPVVCMNADGGTISPATQNKCDGQTATMSTTGSAAGAGATYQWKVSATSGSGYVNVSGGTGATTTTYTTDPLTVGTYYYVLEVTCTNCGPCTQLSSELAVTVNPYPTAAANSNSPVCIGSDLNLSSTTDIGTTFAWSGPNSFSSTAQNPTITGATAAAAGNYNVTVSAAGCSATASTIVVLNPSPVINSTTATPATICEGGSSTLAVQTPAAATYCNSNFISVTYEFISNVTFEAINNTSTGNIGGPVDYTAQVANVTAGTTYTISVTIDPDANDYIYVWVDWNQNGILNDSGEAYTIAGPTSSAGPHTLGIAVPSGATNGSTRMRVMCDYNNASPNPCRSATYGEAEDYTVNVTGGVDAYTYLWNDPSNATTSSVSVSPTTTTTYTVTVTGANGCASTGSATVTVNTPMAGINPSSATLDCVTTSTTLTASGGGTYLWDDNSTDAARVVMAAGAYTVTVTGTNGCTATASASVTSDTTPPAASITPSSAVLDCANTSATLTASGGGTYLWDDNSTDAARVVMAAGAYTVTVTGTNGCTATASASVTSNATPPAATVSGTSSVCAGGNINLTAPSAGASYSWSGPGGYTATGISISRTAVTLAMGGVYTVTVTGSNGCTASASRTVTVNVCAGLTVAANTTSSSGANGTITLNVSGGTPCAGNTYNFAWSGPSSGTATSTSPYIISGLASGWYSVTVTDCGGNSRVVSIFVPKTSRPRTKAEGAIFGDLTAYPNPASETTTVAFTSWTSEHTTVSIYSTDGKQVAVLFDDLTVADSDYQLMWSLDQIPAGIYHVLIATQSGSRETLRIAVVK